VSLEQWGWDTRFAFHFEEAANAVTIVPRDRVVAGRVVRIDRGLARVTDAEQEHALPITGNMALDPPTVGDFVGFDPDEGRLLFIVERRQVIARRQAGSATASQALAANVDTVLLCTPADRLNAAWVERGLTLAWESGASPLVLITKSDLLDDVGATVAEIEQRAVGADVIALSVHDTGSIDRVRDLLAGGKTAVCLGPSGAGKSSLLNALLGGEHVAIGAVREGDKKGRHTTVRRELHPLPGGGLLIDTPGTRELGLVSTSLEGSSGFPDIDALAEGCRFGDCAHLEEPGCAVTAAVADGKLDDARYQSFQRQQRERRWMAERAAATDHEKRQRERGFQRVVRDVKALKRRQRGE
jgi:ribosome biogenesis GTPase